MHLALAQWALWLAIAALIAVAGKFIDDYHIKNSTRSKVRDILIRAFLWLDERTIPDLGGLVLSYFRKLLSVRSAAIAFLALALTGWATLTAFYIGRELYGPPNTEGYFSYIANWIPRSVAALYWAGFLATLVVPSFLGLIVTARWFRKASNASGDIRRLTFLATGLILGSALAFLGTGLLLVTFGPGGYFFFLIAAASLAAAAIPAMLFIGILVLILIRWMLHVGQRVTLSVFDVASAPTGSPFTYFCALLGIVLLAGKVIQALVAG
jgi:hypothetical protein